MSDGDPLSIGMQQPPFNRATASTLLVHTGSIFGDQSNSLWVQRLATPIGTAAIRGDNFSTGPKGGQTIAGVMGMITAPPGDVGVLGVTAAGEPANSGAIGVMGVTGSFGVVGKSLGALSSAGVVGDCDAGIGVHGITISGFAVLGQSTSGIGVTGTSVSDVGVEGGCDSGTGVFGHSRSAMGGSSPDARRLSALLSANSRERGSSPAPY
jgi:hypothetical protein